MTATMSVKKKTPDKIETKKQQNIRLCKITDNENVNVINMILFHCIKMEAYFNEHITG